MTRTRTHTVNIPLALVDEIRSSFDLPADADEGFERAVIQLILSALNAHEPREQHEDALERIGFGEGRNLWDSEEDFQAFRRAAKKSPYMEVAKLARPDGETMQVSFRITDETGAWLEERRRILSKNPDLQVFYGSIDSATAARHIIAQLLIGEGPLAVKPSPGGKPTTLNIPGEMYRQLEAKLNEVKQGGARSSAGVGTVIRWVLATAMDKALRRKDRQVKQHP